LVVVSLPLSTISPLTGDTDLFRVVGVDAEAAVYVMCDEYDKYNVRHNMKDAIQHV
jgi:hypothetical protein